MSEGGNKPQGWFRVYTEILKSRKLRCRISETDAWRYVLILAAHKETEERDESGDLLLVAFESLGDLAFYCSIPEDEFAGTVKRLQDADLLNEDFSPVNWDQRQFKSDSSAYRQKNLRKRKKQVRDVTRDVTVTPSESESETETESYNIQSACEKKSRRPSTPKRRKAGPMSEGQEGFLDTLLNELGLSLAQVIQDLNMRPPKDDNLLSTTQASKIISHLKALANRTSKESAQPAKKTIEEQYAEIGIPYIEPGQEN